MVERGVNVDVYRKVGKRLRILEDNLSLRNLSCDITLMGVGHDGIPEAPIRERLKTADVVTLELTRRVVQAGLANEDSSILERNVFWRTIIDDLREDPEGKRVRGIEVNQTPRIAWKRFNLHYGLATLAASPLSIEVERDHIAGLASLLSQDELKRLEKYNWLITEDISVAVEVINHLSSTMETLADKDKALPVSIKPGISLVCLDLKQMKADKEFKNHKVTFMTPPHPSLPEAFELIDRLIKEFDFLENREAVVLAYDVMLLYLLSPPELTEVKEIAYVTNQYVRDDIRLGKKRVEVVHIGGAVHTSVLCGIFDSSLPHQSRINVTPIFDSEGEKMIPLRSFFRDFIPFDQRMSAVRVCGFEAEVIPKLMGQQVEETILSNLEEFRERLMMYRASSNV